jgi:hypothetical protein
VQPGPPSWSIERRDSKGVLRGRSRAIFLRHQLPQFLRLDVYSDGLIKYGIGTWGYDFGSFVKAAHRGDIVTSLRDNDALLFEERLSGLGSCQVDEFRPLTTTDDLIVWVRGTIEELNPGATDLLDFKGVEYEDIDPRHPGIRRFRTAYAAPGQFVRYDEAGQKIVGRPYRVVVGENGDWLITDWIIYADGASQLGPTGAIVSFRDVVAHAHAGRVTSSVPDGQWINMDGLGLLKPKNASWRISPDGLVAEAEDILARVQGKDGVVSFCVGALQSHIRSPSSETLDLLREAYDLIPAHMREPCLGRDEHSVRSLLGLPPVEHTDNDYTSTRK